MLRIKPEVDLKELKKFGFVDYDKSFYRFDKLNRNECIWVNKLSRLIEIETFSIILGAIVNESLSKVYELIEAGLVEKN